MQFLILLLIFPYLCLIILIYMGLRKLRAFNPVNQGNEFISVIVACRNEQDYLPQLLNDLSKQEYPENLFEVIIIDDNSTDRTFEIASGCKTIKNFLIIKNNGKGKKEAIRSGVNASSGGLIVTTDADCRMGKLWLGTISSFYCSCGADIIVCPVILDECKGFFGKFRELEFLSLQGITAGTILSGNSTMCNGANLAFKREAYLINQENLHPEIPSGDDVFLLHSIKKKKPSVIKWLEAAESAVITVSPSGTGGFLKQRKRWISKAMAYEDPYTIILGIVTFVTILLLIGTLSAAFISHTFLYIYLMLLFLKSIPDYLILRNTTGRYGRSELMVWFLPSQVVYPFYVLIVAFYALLSGKSNN